jgi:hypothetical protein
MDRRKALRNLGILTGGIVLLPSCDFSKEKVSLVLNKLKITTSQENLMKEMVATMLPDGEIPGAEKLMVDDFVWIMVDDCLETDAQESYLKGLLNFDKDIKKLAGKAFLSLVEEDRINALGLIEASKENASENISKDLINFVEITKNFAILGYMQSEYIMTEIMPYSLVPGTYGTCESIDNSKRINVNA